MRRIYFFIFALLFITFSFYVGFYFEDKKPKDVIEGISGVVSHTEFVNGETFLYLDVTPDSDSNRDGNKNNEKDVWVSGFDENILRLLRDLKVGDSFSAKDLWKADESLSSDINHYYILEFYEIRIKDN